MSERKFTIPKAIVDDLIANKFPGLEVKTHDLGNNVTLVMFPGSIPLRGDAFRIPWEGKAGIIRVVQNQKSPTEAVDEACWRLWTELRLIEREINSQSERQAEQVQDQSDVPPEAIRTVGRPSLPVDELDYRLKKAAEAKKLRETVHGITWREVALQIKWKYGAEPRGIKILQDAVSRLERLNLNC